MQEIKEKIKSLLDPVLAQYHAYLTDVAIRNERGGKLVQVFLDTDDGVTIEECAAISRDLAAELERERVFDSSYRLEVSSPGIDKPLKLLRQYKKNVGRRFKVTFQKADTKTTVIGTLTSIADDVLTFEPDKGEPVTLRFSEIIESMEELPW